MKVLVTEGVRSGKSGHAERLLEHEEAVTYVAPGPTPDDDPDPDWAARIVAHRGRRPATWTTLESPDLAAAPSADGAVLVDCLGTWLRDLLGTVSQRLAAACDEVHHVVAGRVLVL